jgi:CMP-N-acetylneuraminic acid synthetase
MNYDQGYVVIPSRMGTKNKGQWKINRKSLVEIALKNTEDRPGVVTSDDTSFAPLAQEYGKSFRERPPIFCGDSSDVIEAVYDCLRGMVDPYLCVHLCQPTSPFIKLAHLVAIEAAFRSNPEVNLVSTVHEIPHNYHYLNQRTLDETTSRMAFKFRERYCTPMKQDKDPVYAFGNVVSVRWSALMERFHPSLWYIEPQMGVKIKWYDSFDVDTQKDLKLARMIARAKWKGENMDDDDPNGTPFVPDPVPPVGESF